MLELSEVDTETTPPKVHIPRCYNAAHDLLMRNKQREDKIAYIDLNGSTSYGKLAKQVNQAANTLLKSGLQRDDRVLLLLHDTVSFPIVFLGAIKAGLIPIPTNTLLTANDIAFMLNDSRARGLVVTAPLWAMLAPLIPSLPDLRTCLIADIPIGESVSSGTDNLNTKMAEALPWFECAETTSDDVCFWLYSSGSTGTPKGTVHLHSHLIQTAELYGRQILGIQENDIVFSAAKLFFAYGLGNSLSFPLSVGATTILLRDRPSPELVFNTLVQNRPSIFYGVPTLYAAMLAYPTPPTPAKLGLRVCASAGEALPADIGRRFSEQYKVDILDGIGSTEMLHIFLSNSPGRVRYGTTGQVVPGYEVRLLDENEQAVPNGTIGELQVKGPSAALNYWNNRSRTKDTFLGNWTRSGDKYIRDDEGYYTYCGRNDDMLKVGGIYVSPFEVEASLQTHPAVLEAAVVGQEDANHLVKPLAFIVLKPGQQATEDELKQHLRSRLAPYKYPREIRFTDELPKTATGKIQRFKLRASLLSEKTS